jgi:RHS repeat-associated protein
MGEGRFLEKLVYHYCLQPCEYTGDYNELLYLRARYYAPGMGRFLTKDRWEGNGNQPITFNHWVYANANPALYTDPTGLYAEVNCSLIQYDDLKGFCDTANGPESDPNTIQARVRFFDRLATYSLAYSLVSSPLDDKNGEGYFYAGLMLKRFLFGFQGNPPNYNTYQLRLRSNSSFTTDPGILRATKIRSSNHAGDEAAEIRPLLYVFLQDYMQPKLQLAACFPYNIFEDFTVYSEQTWRGAYEPRPHDQGWWGAFGHVRIDATYSGINTQLGSTGYNISTQVDYYIDDNYRWTRGKSTPFGPPVASSTIWIPHEWELSLVEAGKAYMFDFEVRWTEQLNIYLPDDFNYFSILGEQANIPLKYLEGKHLNQ